MLIKLLKPNWVHHDEKPIFSVDVHKDCLKFATGGQGMDSGRIVIWNLLPVLSEEAELDQNVPKKLCQMDNHLACVNVVRWSESGQMLASASDDKLVMIWRQSKGSGGGVFGSGGLQKNAENWKCSATLRGHSGDVLDLAWSPQDRWLASCSIDNTIIVWDAQAFPAMVAMLKGHTGLVKGVTWDPVGKFLASQSDDRSVKIWKTSDWSCSHTITEPFEECGGTTHVLRLSWSPDGQYLVSAHAMNGGGPTAQIIEREGWRCDKDFVGHRKAVTCVRFHNAILKRQTPKTNKPQQYCCLAVGSRDRSVSVWMTALQRPLIVVHELFNDSVLDMSWGPEKCILLACSGDGTVACLQFSEEDLGTPLLEEEKNSLYQRVYGKISALENSSNGTQDMLIENAELLNTSQDKLKPPTLPISDHIIPTTQASAFPRETNKTLTSSIPFSSGTNTTQERTHTIAQQLETRTADGKRRITPVFIPPNQEMTENASQHSSSIKSSINSNGIASSMVNTIEAKVVGNLGENPLMSTKPIITESEQIKLDARLIKSATSSVALLVEPHVTNRNIIEAFPNTTVMANKASTTLQTVQITATSNANQYQASTTGPKIAITQTTKCEFQKTALDHRIHVHNGCIQTPNQGLLAKVTAYSFLQLAAGQKLWHIFCGSPITNLNFCTKYVMLCSLDGALRLLHMTNGLAVFPVISLTTPAVHCAFCPAGKLVGVITECGTLRIWNIEEGRIELSTNCTEMLGKFGSVLQFHITGAGVPLVLFANGNSYMFSLQLQSWLVLSAKDSVLRYGLQATIPKETQRNYRKFPLTSVQAASQAFSSSSSSVELNANEWQNSAKIAFIENQIKLCEVINSTEELKHWYSVLAYHLSIGDSETRMRLLLDDLLGSPLDWCSTQSQSHAILSVDKKALFESVLSVIKSHVKWQRIYMEYQELYENFKTQRGDEKS